MLVISAPDGSLPEPNQGWPTFGIRMFSGSNCAPAIVNVGGAMTLPNSAASAELGSA